MNKLTQKELWGKIQNFALDDSTSSFPFSKKLAKEQNWSANFNNKAIEEYRKFIYLCCISPGGASPSETVDKVWHLHLTYTHNYWVDFCRNTLQQDVHHHPGRGSSNENEKHRSWYLETLTLYQQTFETKAPQDIWPPIPSQQQGFKQDIYDPGFFRKLTLIFSGLTLLYISFNNLYHTKGSEFLYHYALISMAGLCVIWFAQQHKHNRLKILIKDNWPQYCTPFQMSHFINGAHRSYQAAIVDLLKRGIIDTSGDAYQLNKTTLIHMDREENPLLLPLLQHYNAGDTFSYREGLGLINSGTVLHPTLEAFYRLSQKVDYQKMIIPGIVLATGMARFFQGMANYKPVGYLVLEMGVFTLICLIILQAYSYTVSVRKQVEVIWNAQNNNGYGNDFISNFTILGTAAITGFAEYAVLTTVFNAVTMQERRAASSGSAGCASGGDSGSSCSGGGDGGGGCGGCGGGD
jgi:hypothetical protein